MRSRIILALIVLVLSVSPVLGAKRYPVRDITNVVVWGAGGGTDTCNRVVSAEMAKILGVNINVINKPGGASGSIGMNYVYNQRSDGYTLVGLSESVVTASVQGGWNQRMSVWDAMIIGGSPDILSVTPSSPYKSIEDLLEAAKKNPGSIKAGAGGAGSIHHLNLLALEKGSGAKFNFIPYKGSAPSQTAAMSGEISVVVTSVAEQQQLIRGGKLRPLAMLTPDAFTLADVGSIPSAFDSYPTLSEHLPISQAIGMAIKADAPASVKQKVQDAFKKALETPAVKEWAQKNYYKISGKTGAAANKEFANLESNFGWTLWELKAAKVNPADLGIPQI